ncbi:hypothetical protein COT30_04900 [Candidatus Micrarchaeota archaeon CG08_land_8_20_14_0_20_49_17]|nr:MAG: hypothetical protein AUJ13_04840 [Candidatus Micrarchaeota archaeon CG1_02_49_24]PIU09339.1 MAG: hypothetical protein COT30_04900 [Candidatus Micrarchaeota archaeon CG08_land_8_20_14_0_20_49_17]PIU82236.1 MAG: hypothetical protein COS70_01950 [Candidatus Micrarchaeota archaeon CG06_land_8_20_14_3_00_50_6]PIZ92132.1 MAG: hypothetical protein COX84_07330 [Candidatus Micrarchaeota archaeon CG_4_10_14_0_2_um_filter_49_7]HII53346.1 hypothetical protein [Candidatus Micrarchaeota archaeon]
MNGQVSVEFIFVVAVSLILLISIYTVAFGQLTSLNRVSNINAVQSALDSIVIASNDAYSQGVGARKMVTLTLPVNLDLVAVGYNPFTGARTKTILVRYNNTYLYATANTWLNGTLPQIAGRYDLWVTCGQQGIYIGNRSSDVDRESVYFLLSPSASSSSAILVKNQDTVSRNFLAGKNFSKPGITFTLTPESFALTADSSGYVTLNVVTSSAGTGIYSGTISINQTGGNINWTIPVTVEVTGGEDDD